MTGSVLITGAGGFIGGHLVEAALAAGLETWAAVRASTRRDYLTDGRIKFLELNFDDEQALERAIADHLAAHGPWTYVIHNLGATKCTNYLDFERVNYYYMRLLVDLLVKHDAVPRVFLLMSSLSVMGPGDERGYTPFGDSDIPQPNTRYGVSKLKAETYLQSVSAFPYTIFRCTGVYGPRDRDYYLMMKSIARGVDFTVGFKRQMLTFLYVKDLARGAMMALEAGPRRRAYFMSEPRAYTQAEFRRLVCDRLGRRVVLPVKAPLWVVRAVCAVAEWWGKVRLRPSTLNGDKYKILCQRNWQCDTSAAERDLGFVAGTSLADGVRETVEWYRQAGWL